MVSTAGGDGTHPVLVVDDDASVRMLLSITLAGAGLRVEEASTGAEALDMVRRRPYSVVLLDNRMPGMSGLAVLARLRAEEMTRTLPVLIVTAEDELDARVNGLQRGADDYVIKPFHPAELVARVRAQLRGRAAWADEVERRLAERSAIAAALCRMHPENTAEQTADVLCAEIQELRDLAGASVVVFAADDVAIPLAVKGSAHGRLSPGVPLSAMAAALCHMHPENTAEQTANVLCAEIQGLRDLAGVSVVVFAADDVAVPLAVKGSAHDRLRPGVPLSPMAAARLRASARTGPWVDNVDGAVAWAAFGPAGEPLGVLALVADASETTGNHLLAAAIDFAAVAGGLITPALLDVDAYDARAHLSEVLRRRSFAPVFQPIVTLSTRGVIGFEALTRFADGVAPQTRFAEAAALNRGLDLETATLSAAIRAASALPPGCWVSVNVSPALVMEGKVLRGLIDHSPFQAVLEITEHDPVDDYGELSAALAELRPHCRLSVDDAGSGFASLRHVVTLEPDYVKLDQSWVKGIDDDPARQALVAGLCHFASKTGSVLIAEGIETDTERGMLTELEVDLGQGFLFGRPLPADAPR